MTWRNSPFALLAFQLLPWLATVKAKKPLCRTQFPAGASEWRDCVVEVGGLAIQGNDAFHQTWGPTFEHYLTDALNGTLGLEFEALPLNFNQNFEYVGTNSLDFIFSNPAAYTCMMVEFNIATVASLVNFRRGNALGRFAGVIFSRAGSNFTTITDLKRARVAAVSISGLGAMQLQQAELLDFGINIMTDVQQITFTANQNKIVEEVENGWADVGFVRTDMIDRSVDKGTTRWENFQVINQLEDESFPFRRSTDFSPEWPLGALPHVPFKVAKEVGRALMRLDWSSPDPVRSAPAIAGSFETFVLPMNYLELLSKMQKIGYYNDATRACLRADDVLQAVTCPPGWVKQRSDAAFCPPERCKDGYTCLCKPCVRLRDPELKLTVKPVKMEWNANIDGSATEAKRRVAESCTRMSVCAYVPRGQKLTWSLLDQISDAVRERINQYRIKSVELLCHLSGSWTPLVRENVTEHGLLTESYALNVTFNDIGNSIVQLRINGEQISMSPVVVEVFEPVEKQVQCPAGYRMEPDGTCSACPPGSKGGHITDSATGLSVAVCVECSVGTFQDRPGQSQCRRCGVGAIAASEGQTACSKCPPGTSTRDEEGAAQCMACAVGTMGIINARNLSVCRECEKGRFGNKTGATQCLSCAPGTFSSVRGLSICPSCPQGNFGDGSVPCQPCPRGTYLPLGSPDPSRCQKCEGGMITNHSAAVDAAMCRCPEGSFHLPGGGCQSCGSRSEWQGLECPGGNGPPLQVRGFWVDVRDPVARAARTYSIYRCRDTYECPAGPLGSCAEGREGPACNDCVSGHVRGDLGRCTPCFASDYLPMIGAAFVLLLCLGALVIMAEADTCQQSVNRLTVLVVFGQVVMAVQALGAIRQMSILWVEPVKTILGVLKVFTLDLDLLQLACVTQNDSPLMQFSLQLLAYPCFVLALLHVVALFRLMRRPVSLDALINLNGILLFMLFISLTLTVLKPFQCAPNPNETTSLSTNPGIVCWTSDDHLVLVILAILGMLAYPVPILSWTCWTTLKYPRRVHSGQGLALIRRHRFLFERFAVDRYYYGLLLLIRNLAVALVPVAFVSLPSAQLLFMGFVLLIGLMVQSRLWPWRTQDSNRADMGTVGCLVMVVITCAPLVDKDVEESSLLSSVCLGSTVIGSLLIGLCTIAHGVYRRLRPRRAYDIFLCHHKAGAGCLCRYIKFELTKLADCNVFLDSDDLQDLDALFETVRCNCSNLVVVLTPELLKRIWCSGEIVTAFRNHIHMVPLRCDGFHPLSEEDLGSVHAFWAEEEKHLLGQYGITIEGVVEAYRHLLALPFLIFERCAAQPKQEAVLLELIKGCKLSRRGFGDSCSSTGKPGIMIMGAMSDLEALATCQIVETVVQRNLQTEAMTVRSVRDMERSAHHANCVIVVLTRGILADAQFLESFCALHTHIDGSSVEFLLVNADPGFEFPGSNYYGRLSSGQERQFEACVPSDQQPWLADALKSLFTVLALPLSPKASESLLKQQLEEVCTRYRTASKCGSPLRRSMTGQASSAMAVRNTSSSGQSGSLRPVDWTGKEDLASRLPTEDACLELVQKVKGKGDVLEEEEEALDEELVEEFQEENNMWEEEEAGDEEAVQTLTRQPGRTLTRVECIRVSM